MSDLISREALLVVPHVRKVSEYDETGEYITYFAVPEDDIKNAPAVDAEPVVRCKDCAFYIPWGDERKICGRVGAYYGDTKPDDFCSRSVRMDLEDTE